MESIDLGLKRRPFYKPIPAIFLKQQIKKRTYDIKSNSESNRADRASFDTGSLIDLFHSTFLELHMHNNKKIDALKIGYFMIRT